MFTFDLFGISQDFSIYFKVNSAVKSGVFKKTFIFCLLQGGRYQGIIFSLSQVHFIFSPCLPRIFKGHDESIEKPFALELLQFFTPYD